MGALAVSVALLAGCSADGAPPAPVTAEPAPTAVPPTGAPPTAAPPTPAATAPEDPDPAAAVLGLELVADLDAPTALAVRPGDDALYIAERAGTVRPVTRDGDVGEPVIDLREDTTTDGERGLLGLAWSPDGDRLYLSSTDREGSTRLDAVAVAPGSGGLLDLATRTTLLEVPQPAANHNGGVLHIGPDGHLWLALGDGGAPADRFGNGQRPDTLLGTLLRIDPEGTGPGGRPYAIPPDNPWADGGEGAPEVWAYGLRNPWRFSFDAETGRLWVADVGQDEVEEIDAVPADEPGLNYGWPRFEGDQPFDGQPAEGPVVAPVHTYRHGDRGGCSITGGYVYRGQAIPALRGAYLYSDFCDGRIFALDLTADGQVQGDVDTGLAVDAPVAFGQGSDAELYVLSLEGPVHRIVGG